MTRILTFLHLIPKSYLKHISPFLITTFKYPSIAIPSKPTNFSSKEKFKKPNPSKIKNYTILNHSALRGGNVLRRGNEAVRILSCWKLPKRVGSAEVQLVPRDSWPAKRDSGARRSQRGRLQGALPGRKVLRRPGRPVPELRPRFLPAERGQLLVFAVRPGKNDENGGGRVTGGVQGRVRIRAAIGRGREMRALPERELQDSGRPGRVPGVPCWQNDPEHGLRGDRGVLFARLRAGNLLERDVERVHGVQEGDLSVGASTDLLHTLPP